MGAQAQFHFLLLQLQPHTPFTSCSLNPNTFTNTKFWSCCPVKYRSKWDANAGPTPSGRSRFNHEDDGFYSDTDDHPGGFSTKQRIWWSEKDSDFDFDNPWEVDEEDEFWIFKILRAFGWIFPAIAISLLLGTGPNAFLMALAVPLGQSLVSLAVDKVWGSASNKPKSRSRTKSRRKPFARATRNSKTSQVKQENEAGKGRGSYQSWVATDGGSYEKDGKSGPRFGGWDELDKKVGNEKAAKSSASQIENELPKHQKKGKLSRIGRMRDKPLLLRLLIAVFPFLGSWTKLLF
ncbi:uncharacterized protein LOC116145769 isoform X3 [Pistacia vera]|uniref:uncharacterized protein LOC116145769 isoform X1 n=1 Tax=Pistacia vera TaxID=55513 RepID=UPI001263571F|nr:uncharacterized protein LOC116145769 isoform X1 [Pistacia vera]XP_031287071.1 uncharacterized protein LOC116145769 isoform X2 [Pistacia vera]XP_031287072.1 uncharacterized protein LOC116145769 isoform X3 [Pistacia vera]